MNEMLTTNFLTFIHTVCIMYLWVNEILLSTIC